MGILRIILALAILIGHVDALNFPDTAFPYVTYGKFHGAVWLHCFFMIAGFFSDRLLALARRQGHTRFTLAWRFYAARLLRLLPNYYFILLLTLALYWLNKYGVIQAISNPMQYMDKLPSRGIMHYVNNAFPFTSATLYPFVPSKTNVLAPVLIVYAAWSLSQDLAWLAIAPLVLSRNSILKLISILAVALCYTFWLDGIYRDYLVVTVVYFIMGVWANRFYDRYLTHWKFSIYGMVAMYALLGVIAVYVFNYQLAVALTSNTVAYWTFILCIWLALPWLYAASMDFLKDRWLGELAYPVFLNHKLVFYVLVMFAPPSANTLYIGLMLSLLLSGLMLRAIDMPIQRWRRKHL